MDIGTTSMLLKVPQMETLTRKREHVEIGTFSREILLLMQKRVQIGTLST